MLPDQQAEIVLTAMTLRGIGSYLHGARLEFRPLTILCGANGSGKSTWMKVLNILRESLTRDLLPFDLAVVDYEANDIRLLNSFYHLADADAQDTVADSEETNKYGPPGTIGLEFVSMCDLRLLGGMYGDNTSVQGLPQEFLWLGQVPQGTRVRVRLAHPGYNDDYEETPELRHLVELQLNDLYTIRMTGARDPHQRRREGQTRPSRTKPYELSCSWGFLPGADLSRTDLVSLATITDLAALRCDWHNPDLHEDLASFVIKQFDNFLRGLLGKVLGGCFYIGAVRQPHTYLSLRDIENNASIRDLSSRSVGSSGEYSWLLERHFFTNRMSPLDLSPFTPDCIDSEGCIELFSTSSRSQFPKLEHIWRCAAPKARKQVALSLAQKPVMASEIAASVSDFLNSMLEQRDIFSAELWGEPAECIGPDGEMPDELFTFEDEEIEYYSRVYDQLDGQELLRFNRLLIESALMGRELPRNGLLRTGSCSFDTYLSGWLEYLTSARIGPASDEQMWIREWFQDRSQSKLESSPCRTDYLIGLKPKNHSLHRGTLRMERVLHPCFGKGHFGEVQPPRQLSSGFHQVFPMIVQLGLMRRGELVGIENPEVHLHPSLQLRATEMLLALARSGRQILVETHSDLLIRRAIRAILEEDISQSDIQIYFTDLSQSVEMGMNHHHTEFRYSSISPLRVDDRGRIANWPEGFMDDDVRESQRLMDIMYGGGPEGGDEDD